MDRESNRHVAARLARQFYKNQISFDQLMMNYPDDSEDKDIEELFYLIEHEPKKGGLFGVSVSEHADYIKDIEKLILKLETADK